ncbi:hypothetical protein PAPYR_11592 [Paratrimastix pyriformis]|uniref:Uncharacterized protein n=1 Tax=Paratrimastix pyriformis TaxID=342808 RepID=A0ABQ8U3H4_9EUKA|nr:hypothetical protein PAPYR_11592 [Paratrimastix pyriformis]
MVDQRLVNLTHAPDPGQQRRSGSSPLLTEMEARMGCVFDDIVAEFLPVTQETRVQSPALAFLLFVLFVGGLVVEYHVAIVVTRVQFPADASSFFSPSYRGLHPVVDGPCAVQA